jgi:polysaccharide pyruvyl transferase WcaK-like protein
MTAGRTRVGIFGLLGSGNIGNDASMEAVLHYLRASHPDAVIDAMCFGPERVRSMYGIDAVPLAWYCRYETRASGITAIGLKAAGKIFDAVRIASWVRRHDVVIVPGMGVLETTLPLRALGTPYEMFLLCASGRLFGTKVALVSVGANVIKQRLARWLCRSAARLAFYCSYRNVSSRDAMLPRRSGKLPDEVYPDLAFALPMAPAPAGDMRLVGLGVMDFHGSNDERRQASEIHESYVAGVKRFALWLVDGGRSVRLFVGDTKGCDNEVVARLLAELRADRPGMPAEQVTSVEASTFDEVAAALAPVGTVVAARFHNVICALRLCKPTISIGYAAKHDALMADMGLAEFCQSARALDVDRLILQFTDLESRAPELRTQIAERNAALAAQLETQFAVLSAVLFPGSPRAGQVPNVQDSVGSGAV